MQMALMMSAIANRGTLWRQHYTGGSSIPTAARSKQLPERLGEAPLKDGPGTTSRAPCAWWSPPAPGRGAHRRPEVFGKTGTAQNSGGDDHAWFVSYARRPGESAQVAVAVLVENSGHGSLAAA